MLFHLHGSLPLCLLLVTLSGCPTDAPPAADDDVGDDDSTGTDDDDTAEEVAVPEGGMEPGVPGALVGLRAFTEVDGAVLTSAPVEVSLLEPTEDARDRGDRGGSERTTGEAVAIDLRERLVRGAGR